MRVTIDRIEGDFAVIETGCGATVDMPAILLPEGAKEGDILDISILHEETDRRHEEIDRLMESVWNE